MVQGSSKDICAIMLFGAVGGPVPSEMHFKRECFVLSNIVSLPSYDSGGRRVYRKSSKDGKIHMTKSGLSAFEDLLRMHSDDPEFNEALAKAAFVRSLYDEMSSEEIGYLERKA